MDKPCDHKSAGVLVEKGENILIIERKRFPAGFALPAGHLDGDSFEEAARRELWEETGVTTEEVEQLLDIELPNPCRRTDGTHHHWQVFRAKNWSGKLKRAEDETKSIEWAAPERIKKLALRTEEFSKKHNVSVADLTNVTKALSNDFEWQSSPGLEPVWFYLLKHLKII